MSSTSHPTVSLQLDYRNGLCSAGAALAVATHVALCPWCAEASLKPWGGRNLPGLLATDHGIRAETYAQVLGAQVLEGWHDGGGGVRLAELKGVAGIGEAAYLLDAAAGAAAHLPGVMFLVVLQGLMVEGPSSLKRGDFVDFATTPFLNLKGVGPQGCICLIIREAI